MTMSRNAADKNSAHTSSSGGPSTSSAVRPQARRGPSGAWSRLKPAVIDPLDAYGLPSKGETRLHDHKTQEVYYSKIVERYMKFCASAGRGEGLESAFSALSVKDPAGGTTPLPSAATTSDSSNAATTGNNSSNSCNARPSLPHRPLSATERPNDMPAILLAMRKLREGILGSRRRDNFAQRAYMFIIHASILTQSWESYQPALLYLLLQIHPTTPLSVPELQEFVGYRVLDLACRQYELLDAFRVRREFALRERRVQAVLSALVHDDWVRFWRARRAVDGYQRAIMGFAVERVRLHALKCVGRSYLVVEKGFVERAGDAAWEELVKGGVGWELQESGSVVVRRAKPK